MFNSHSCSTSLSFSLCIFTTWLESITSRVLQMLSATWIFFVMEVWIFLFVSVLWTGIVSFLIWEGNHITVVVEVGAKQQISLLTCLFVNFFPSLIHAQCRNKHRRSNRKIIFCQYKLGFVKTITNWQCYCLQHVEI